MFFRKLEVERVKQRRRDELYLHQRESLPGAKPRPCIEYWVLEGARLSLPNEAARVKD